MKRVLVVWLVCFTCQLSFAEEIKIGFVDLNKVITTIDEGKKIKGVLEKEMLAKKGALEKEQKEIQEEAEKLQKRSALMNETARAEKDAELQRRAQAFQRKYMETQMELQKRDQELSKPLLEKVRSIIESVGEKKNFQLVLEKNEGAVLYAAKGADLTSEVIAALESQSKKKS